MDREILREKFVDLLEQEMWERPASLPDSLNLREELSLDSVDLLTISLRAEEQLGVSLDSNDFVGINTVGDLLTTIQVKLAAKDQSQAA